MKTDSLFYAILQTLPGTFFEIMGQPGDTAAGYHFTAVEIKEPTFRLDGVFVPNVPEGPIYFTEVQFQLDKGFYWRLFAEIFLYLEQQKPEHNWHAVVLFATPNLNPGVPKAFLALEESHLTVLYLVDLLKRENPSPGIEIIQVIMASEDEAMELAKRVSQKVRKEPEVGKQNQEIIRLFESVLIYKFPAMTTKELEAMFQLEDFKHTRVYQEALEEGELKMVPLLLQAGLSVEQISAQSGLELEVVKKAAAQPPVLPAHSSVGLSPRS